MFFQTLFVNNPQHPLSCISVSQSTVLLHIPHTELDKTMFLLGLQNIHVKLETGLDLVYALSLTHTQGVGHLRRRAKLQLVH